MVATWRLQSYTKRWLFSILRSPAYFFDITPTGRIMDRFAKDMDTVDLMVIFNMTRTANFSMEALCTAGLIVYSTPMVVVAMVPLAIMYYLIQVQNISTMHPQDPQDLQNFVSKTKRLNNMANLLVSSLTLIIFMIFGGVFSSSITKLLVLNFTFCIQIFCRGTVLWAVFELSNALR